VDTLEPIPQPIDSDLKSAPLIQWINPENPPWNSGLAFGLWLLSVFFIMFVPVIFLFPYLISSGIMQQGSERLAEFSVNDPTAIVIQMAAVVPAHLLTILAAWFVITKFRRYDFREMLGWKSGGIRWFHHLLILIGFFVLAGFVGQFFPETENQLIRILKSSRTAVFIVAFMATFTAPLVEEVIYRGVLYSAFQRTFGVPAAVAAVTLLFSLVHVPQYYESPSTILLLTVLSLILTLMRVFSGNLLPCIIFHTLINGIQSVGLIAEPYLKEYTEPAATAMSIGLK